MITVKSFSMDRSKGSAAQSLGFGDVTLHYNNAKEQGGQDFGIRDANRIKEVQFKASHILLILFFLWILHVPSLRSLSTC